MCAQVRKHNLIDPPPLIILRKFSMTSVGRSLNLKEHIKEEI